MDSPHVSQAQCLPLGAPLDTEGAWEFLREARGPFYHTAASDLGCKSGVRVGGAHPFLRLS